MSYFRKKLERRTFSQDRYYILIKRQKSGEASLHDLEELDEIVNRVPDIREKVLRENFEELSDESGEHPGEPLNTPSKTWFKRKANLWNRIRALLKQVFTSQINGIRQEFKALC
jgi:hypothetical protein